MKKILVFLLLFCASHAGATGVEKLMLDEVAYEPYIARINHSQPLTLRQLEEKPQLFDKYEGKRITMLGFVVPIDGDPFFNKGWLVAESYISGPTPTENAKVQFVCENKVQYKPFEVYQVTGVIEKKKDGDRTIRMITAQYAEPQGSLSKISYSPDLRIEAKDLPQLKWPEVALPRDEIGDLIATDAVTLSIPKKLTELEGQLVAFETWMLDPAKAGFSAPATGSYNVTYFVIDEGSCLCCGLPAKYDMGSVAIIQPVHALPERVKGGVFIGRLKLNERNNYAEHGLFTLSEARLVKPLSPPDMVLPAGDPPKVRPEELLPALLRNQQLKTPTGQGH